VPVVRSLEEQRRSSSTLTVRIRRTYFGVGRVAAGKAKALFSGSFGSYVDEGRCEGS
jgi:hypothetical protein